MRCDTQNKLLTATHSPFKICGPACTREAYVERSGRIIDRESPFVVILLFQSTIAEQVSGQKRTLLGGGNNLFRWLNMVDNMNICITNT